MYKITQRNNFYYCRCQVVCNINSLHIPDTVVDVVVVSNDVIIGVDIPFGVVILGGIVLVAVDGLSAKMVFIICELMIDLWIILYFKTRMN